MEKSEEILEKVYGEIRPNEMWVLPLAIENLVKNEIRTLPLKEVSEQEGRCPTTSAGMRFFLDHFFVQHYFQIQNAIIKYLVSEYALEQINHNRLRVLDIGAGPAVGVLAITEIIRTIIRESNLIYPPIQVEYVCVEPSEICRSTGLKMASRYFAHLHFENKTEFRVHLSDISIPFPDCLDELKPLSQNKADFQVILLSYVLNPLFDTYRIEDIQNGIEQLKSMLAPYGEILVIQDRFSEDKIEITASMLGTEMEEQELTQKVYSAYMDRDTQSYHYCVCQVQANQIMSAAGDYAVGTAG